MEIELQERQLSVTKHCAALFVCPYFLHGGHGVKNDVYVLAIAEEITGACISYPGMV